MFSPDGDGFWFKYDTEKVFIEPWGPDALRVRATRGPSLPAEDWALNDKPPAGSSQVTIGEAEATVTNGKIRAVMTRGGKLRVYNRDGALLLEEYTRNRRDVTDPKVSALKVAGREFRPIPGTEQSHATLRLESLSDGERIFGMGQYQQPRLDLKGCDLELAHRNSQASVPFALSSLGYGLLWNNPAVGRAVFGYNATTFEAYSTRALDYWVVAGDAPADIVRAYTGVTGRVPMMPEYGLGFWQCKLRYQTQDELLQVAREYRRRDLPIDLIVIDFFHWPKQGDWRFDPQYWPDPEAMVRELRELKIELMVSVWPTVDRRSENYQEMVEGGYLISVDRGLRQAMNFEGETIHWDATNPQARRYLWDKCKANYWDLGIRVFWLDEAEPEYSRYDFDNYRYHLGANLSIGNLYPREYARAFYEGMSGEMEGRKGGGGDEDKEKEEAGKEEPEEGIVNLIRCAWAGSQKYGALVWSGDVGSSWASLRNQVAAGLNMGVAGLAWWTTDIGGFHGGDPEDPAFRELLVRWFQWAAFCPVMRLHGDREPRQPQLVLPRPPGNDNHNNPEPNGATCRSGAANEVWSYGPAVEAVCRAYLGLREQLRPYTRRLMREAHDTGAPLMRPLFYEFPADPRSWAVHDQYMYGDRFLCCPVLEPGLRTMDVYLPPLGEGDKWQTWDGEEVSAGGEQVTVPCPLETMPVFVRRSKACL